MSRLRLSDERQQCGVEPALRLHSSAPLARGVAAALPLALAVWACAIGALVLLI